MFGLFKKRKSEISDRALKLVAFSRTVISTQLALSDHSMADLADKPWALGYVFGCHDAALQRGSIDDQTESLAAMTISFLELSEGAQVGAVLLGRCLREQRDPQFVAGAIAGGSDLQRSLAPNGNPPMTLFEYLNSLSGDT